MFVKGTLKKSRHIINSSSLTISFWLFSGDFHHVLLNSLLDAIFQGS